MRSPSPSPTDIEITPPPPPLPTRRTLFIFEMPPRLFLIGTATCHHRLYARREHWLGGTVHLSDARFCARFGGMLENGYRMRARMLLQTHTHTHTRAHPVCSLFICAKRSDRRRRRAASKILLNTPNGYVLSLRCRAACGAVKIRHTTVAAHTNRVKNVMIICA